MPPTPTITVFHSAPRIVGMGQHLEVIGQREALGLRIKKTQLQHLHNGPDQQQDNHGQRPAP
jgi:hypothetical protein